MTTTMSSAADPASSATAPLPGYPRRIACAAPGAGTPRTAWGAAGPTDTTDHGGWPDPPFRDRRPDLCSTRRPHAAGSPMSPGSDAAPVPAVPAGPRRPARRSSQRRPLRASRAGERNCGRPGPPHMRAALADRRHTRRGPAGLKARRRGGLGVRGGAAGAWRWAPCCPGVHCSSRRSRPPSPGALGLLGQRRRAMTVGAGEAEPSLCAMWTAVPCVRLEGTPAMSLTSETGGSGGACSTPRRDGVRRLSGGAAGPRSSWGKGEAACAGRALRQCSC